MTALQEATEIFCYMHYGAEVETSFFMEQMWQKNKKILLPKVVGKQMDFYYINNFSQLTTGYRGIKEPDITQNLELFSMTDYKKLYPVMIMPGVAFDANRNRMGYGGGFYDRYLAMLEQNHCNLYKILVAFDLQEVPSVLPEIHDIQPDVILTESREIKS